MSQSNLSNTHTDENAVRLIAAGVVITTLFFLIFKSALLATLLAADFAIRAFTTRKSPLALLAGFMLKTANIQPKPIFAAPKKFAALLGFIFAESIAILLVLNLSLTADVVSSILLACAILESLFRVCLGCYFFDWFVAPFQNRKKGQA